MFWVQAAGTHEYQFWLSQGAGVALAVFVVSLWRKDRQGWIDRYMEDRKDSEARYDRLALDYRTLIEANTRAIVELSAAVLRGIIDCPYAEKAEPVSHRKGDSDPGSSKSRYR